MTVSTATANPEALHPSIWRASQLARAHIRCVDTGHASLSNQLPGGGWPLSSLINLMIKQPGIGEVDCSRRPSRGSPSAASSCCSQPTSRRPWHWHRSACLHLRSCGRGQTVRRISYGLQSRCYVAVAAARCCSGKTNCAMRVPAVFI